MGLFSETVTQVGTSVSRVIQDDMLPDAIKTGITRAILQEGDVSDHIMEELVGSVGVRADRMYEYAKRAYPYGLPSGQTVAASVGLPEVSAVLSALEGQPVDIEYSCLGSPNSLHMGWMQIIAQFGYDTTTNELVGWKTNKGESVFLDDMVVVIPKADMGNYTESALGMWGTSPRSGASPSRPGLSELMASLVDFSPVEASTEATEDSIRIIGAYVSKQLGPEGAFTEVGKVEQSLPLVDAYGHPEKDYFHVKYKVGGVAKYWMYLVGSGTHPSLDALINLVPQTSGTFFPFAYFRYNKKSEIEDTTSAEYRASKKLVKYLGMDYDAVAEAIDENPDIADIQQAMLIMAVPANTKDPVESRYLFSFFDNLYYSKSRQYRSPAEADINFVFTWVGNNNRSSTVIQDKRFKIVLGDDGIFKKMVVGSIGPVGAHTCGMSQEPVQRMYHDPDNGQPIYQMVPLKYHYYRKQISSNIYEEILVVDLQVRYYVLEKYYSTGNEDDAILLIPIDRSISKEYSLPDRETLYARSLHFVFNSAIITKLKWYQTGFFSFVIMVVAIVIAMVSFQYQLVAAAVAAGTAITLSIVAMVLLEQLLIGLIVGALLKLFVKAVGIEFAFLIAIVAAMVGGYQAIQAGSVTGAPWAQELLQLSTGIAKGVSDNLQDMMKDLVGDFQNLAAMQSDFDKELARANKLLDSNNHLSPFTIFGESPDDFYNRTVHSSNIGMNGISAISSYVDIALRLPKLDETIGENNYV